MFTGLVEALGTVRSLTDEGDAKRIVVEVPTSFLENAPPNKRLGDSIAINGCCLTAVAADGVMWSFQAGHETLAKTNLGRLRIGDVVNLERAMSADGRFGGHIVQGHVDGLGEILSVRQDGEGWRIRLKPPGDIAHLIAQKGSIAIAGVSLTVNEVDSEGFGVLIIPHTWAVTTLSKLRTGDKVNLEADMMARYAARLVEARRNA